VLVGIGEPPDEAPVRFNETVKEMLPDVAVMIAIWVVKADAAVK
jgi:hypothetical protein